MMQQWNGHGNMMQPHCGNRHMMQPQCGPGNMTQPVICPTQYRCHDQFMPREVPFIHPIVNVNRQHIVEIPRHYYTETTRNVMGETVQARPGFGPPMGGFGPQYGGRNNRPFR